MRHVLLASLAGLMGLGCGSKAPETGTDAGADLREVPGDTGRTDVHLSDVGGDMSDATMTPVPTQAPRRWPEEPRLTHDVDRDLAAALEAEKLAGACAAYASGQTDEETKLRCGKWMFFYETFGTVGVPKPILEFNQRWFGDSYFGVGFANFGMIADPASETGMPLGLAPTTGKAGTVETLAFTCASCHFGKMPDGHYAVGYGNMSLDYGRFIATLGAPLQMAFNENNPEIHPAVRAELLAPVQQAKEDSAFVPDAAATGLSLLGAGSGTGIDVEMQGRECVRFEGVGDDVSSGGRRWNLSTFERLDPNRSSTTSWRASGRRSSTSGRRGVAPAK